jgi:glyoxylase-like metal-dependent hydrolase (beta-lactamase superfamily II)
MVWKIGQVKVSLVREQFQASPLELMFTNCDPAVLDANLDWLAPYMHEDGRLLFSSHSLVLETPTMTIMVDTCYGEHHTPEENYAIDWVPYLPALADAGYAPEDIDIVLCTHLHSDHMGWNTRLQDGKWVPTFPNARYLVAAKEYEYTKAEGAETEIMGFKASGEFENAIGPIEAADMLDLIETDYRVCDEVRIAGAPGHTPGHVVVHIDSEGKKAVLTGDTLHHPIQFAAPRWKMFLDWDADVAVETRLALMEHAATERVQVFGAHFTASSCGFVTKAGDETYRWVDAGAGEA